MVITTSRKSKQETIDKTMRGITRISEVVVFCPTCKTMETVWFANGWLVHTRKFTQDNKRVYHDCGSNEPCRLFSNSH